MRYLALAAWDCSAPTCKNDRVVNADQTMQYRVRGATNAPEAASALAIKMKLDMDPESAATLMAPNARDAKCTTLTAPAMAWSQFKSEAGSAAMHTTSSDTTKLTHRATIVATTGRS